MKYQIEVTSHDIQDGCMGDAMDCPVARAMRRTLGKRVVAVTGSAWLDAIGSAIPRRVPPEVTSFVRAYDHDQPVAPFTFEVEL